MAFRARDGRPFPRRDQMNAYNERTSGSARPANSKPSESPGRAEPEPPQNPRDSGEGAGGEEGGDLSGMDINQVVAQHGPAERVEIEHGPNGHTVTSHHGGVTHRSSHPTPHAAHLAAADAAGLNSPQMMGAAPATEAPAMQIPGMGS